MATDFYSDSPGAGCSIPPLVNRKTRSYPTKVKAGEIIFGGNEVVIIAGPCAVENHEQLTSTARIVKAGGASVLRGGAFKPRSSPYSFQG